MSANKTPALSLSLPGYEWQVLVALFEQVQTHAQSCRGWVQGAPVIPDWLPRNTEPQEDVQVVAEKKAWGNVIVLLQQLVDHYQLHSPYDFDFATVLPNYGERQTIMMRYYTYVQESSVGIPVSGDPFCWIGTSVLAQYFFYRITEQVLKVQTIGQSKSAKAERRPPPTEIADYLYITIEKPGRTPAFKEIQQRLPAAVLLFAMTLLWKGGPDTEALAVAAREIEQLKAEALFGKPEELMTSDLMRMVAKNLAILAHRAGGVRKFGLFLEVNPFYKP